MERTVTGGKDGFYWQQRKSRPPVPAVARAIIDTQWNGYRFFASARTKEDDR